MDFWTDCVLVERVEGKVGGRPVIIGTRIEPELLIVEADSGRTPEQTHEDFPTLPVGLIRDIQAFAEKQRQLVP